MDKITVDCYRIELSLLDFERNGLGDLIYAIENWCDDHPMNKRDAGNQFFMDFMKDSKQLTIERD